MSYEKKKKSVKLGEKFKVGNRTVVVNLAGTGNNEINIYSDEYKKLSDEEKLKIIRKQIANLFTEKKNKYIFVSYKGKKMKMDRDKYGIYKDLVEREKALEKRICNKDEQTTENEISKISFYDKCIAPVAIGISAVWGKIFKKISNKKNKVSDAFNKIINKFKNKKIKKTKKIRNKKNKVSDTFNKIINKFKNKNKDTITTIKKKENNKKRITALFLALTLFLTGHGLSKCNKNSNYGNDTVTNSISQNTDDNTTNNNDINVDTNTNINTNNDNINVDTNTDTNIDTDNDNNQKETDMVELSFDDIVTINDNSFIYTNCYDATYSTNSYNPYYNGYYERDVQGVVYELNGKIYILYENDVNASSKKKELEDKGAIITAVLVTRNDITHTGEYEGYYNINSVKVKSRK